MEGEGHNATDPYDWMLQDFESRNETGQKYYCDNLSSWLVEFYLVPDDDNPIWSSFVQVVDHIQLFANLSNEYSAEEWKAIWLDPEERVIFLVIDHFTVNVCNREYCAGLGWEGNSDIAGTGMMVTYYVEAILASIYIVALCAEPYTKKINQRGRRRGRESKMINAIVTAITESSSSLLNSMILFSLAMLVAALFRYAVALAERTQVVKAITTYDRICLLFLSVFSIFPPVLLEVCMPSRRRKRLRLFVWTSIIATTIVVRVLAQVAPGISMDIDFDKKNEGTVKSLLWEDACSPDQSHMWRSIRAVECVVPVVCVFWLTLKLPWLQRYESVGLCHSLWTKLVACLSFSGMWLFLGLFTAYRSAMAKSSSESNREVEWSFGQVLALATWAPIFVEIGYLSIFGPEEGLEGNLSYNFNVVRALPASDRQDQHLGMALPLMKDERSAAGESQISLQHDSDDEEHMGQIASIEERF